MKQTDNLPSRLRESMFRRFETTIATIVRNYPAVTYIDRGNMSSATVAARLRDAMLSLYKFEWPTTIVDVAKFRTNREDIKVSHQETTIIAGSSAAIALSKTCNILPLELLEEETPAITVDIDQLKLICFLAAKQAFARPVAVIIGWDIEVSYFEDNYDVRIDKKENGVYHIS